MYDLELDSADLELIPVDQGADVDALVSQANSAGPDSHERSMAYFYAHLGVGEARSYRVWAESMGFSTIA